MFSLGVQIQSWVRNVRQRECLTPFNARATSSTVVFVAFVTSPRFRETDAQFLPALNNLRFRAADERAQNFHAAVCAEMNGSGYCVHEFGTAVGEDDVVARVRSDDDGTCADGFRKSRRCREKDAVAERHDGLLHRGRFIVRVGDARSGLQQRGTKVFADEIQSDDFVADTDPPTMEHRKRNLPVVVLRAVVETDASNDFMDCRSCVQRTHGIQTTADQNDDFAFHWIASDLTTDIRSDGLAKTPLIISSLAARNSGVVRVERS